MVSESAFHSDDGGRLTGPIAAFERGTEVTPSVYALQHHLALEVVAHLHEDGVPFVFRGGTALHTKLSDRRRFSSDVDITTTDRTAVHESLRGFPQRFPKSAVELVEPPQDLRVEGVSHTLSFKNATPVDIMVDVVEAKEPTDSVEPMRLREGALDWKVEVLAPTFAAFVGQKLAVLGPQTIGKAVGLNPRHARDNQGVCKQIFDLRELLRRTTLDPAAIVRAYDGAVEEANRLRSTNHLRAACLADARVLLAHLRRPRINEKAQETRYGLWSGFRDSMRWIAARTVWQDADYRIAGGVITRLASQLETGDLNLEVVRAPLADEVPTVVRQRLTAAEAEEWFVTVEFGGNARVAWAWAPGSWYA